MRNNQFSWKQILEKKKPLEWILLEPLEAVSERLSGVFVVNMGFGLENECCNIGERERGDEPAHCF